MKAVLSISIMFCVTLFFSCSQEKKQAPDTANEEKVVSNDTLSKADVQIISAGEKIFIGDCVSCHGVDGKKKHSGAKDLSISTLSLDEIVKVISSAQVIGNRLHAPRFPAILTDDEIKKVGEYVITLRK